jgi:hypothetical protein
MFVATKGKVRAWFTKFIMFETQVMGMSIIQLGNAFK